jgi:hypothetical protein
VKLLDFTEVWFCVRDLARLFSIWKIEILILMWTVQDSILIFLPCSSLDWREWWESVSTVYKFLKLGKWGIFGDGYSVELRQVPCQQGWPSCRSLLPPPLSLEVIEKLAIGNVFGSLVYLSYAGFCWFVVGNLNPFDVIAAWHKETAGDLMICWGIKDSRP